MKKCSPHVGESNKSVAVQILYLEGREVGGGVKWYEESSCVIQEGRAVTLPKEKMSSILLVGIYLERQWPKLAARKGHNWFVTRTATDTSTLMPTPTPITAAATTVSLYITTLALFFKHVCCFPATSYPLLIFILRASSCPPLRGWTTTLPIYNMYIVDKATGIQKKNCKITRLRCSLGLQRESCVGSTVAPRKRRAQAPFRNCISLYCNALY